VVSNAIDKELERLREKIAPILRRLGVRRASVFGSLARGEGNEESDVDLLVELEPGRSLLDLAELKVELEEVLGRRVDVITYDSLHPLLRERVLREQRRIL
jgi:predicted nucleotidyltransferase